MQIRSTSGIRLVVLLVIIIGIGVSLTVLAVSARGWLAASRSSGKHTTTPAAGNLSPAVIQTSKTDSQVEVELITITPSGLRWRT